MTDFRPVVYLKDLCPWCFRFRLFLLESGLQDRFDLRVFVPGDAQDVAIREELAPHFDTITLPLHPVSFLGASFRGQSPLAAGGPFVS